MEGQLIARIMHALHRYASGAAVITTLFHAYRMLFMERFNGPRWLAWITGVLMTAILWGAGVAGYWLIWDDRAQLITDSFVRFLERFTPYAPAFVSVLVSAERSGKSWPILLLIFAAHILLFLLAAGFFWLHIRRLSRAKWLPAPQWAIGMGVVLFLGSVLFPMGMLSQANPAQLPGPIQIDPLFLFYLPASGRTAVWLWSGLLLLVALFATLPWLPRRKQPPLPRVRVIEDNCTGCTRCALDCPYKALAMAEGEEGSLYKYRAVADHDKCVSCGICIGSCDDLAITLGDTPPELLWITVSDRLRRLQDVAPDGQVKIVFTCERYAAQSARSYLSQTNGTSVAAAADEQLPMAVIPLPCAGAVPPDLLIDTLDAGAAEVQVVGCPPDDCAHREGNLWAEQRLTRQRAPRLKRAYANVPIAATWLPPDAFEEALREEVDQEQSNWLESRRIFQLLTWHNFLPAFSMLALVMALQIWLTDLPFTPFAPDSAALRLVLSLPAAPFGQMAADSDILTDAELRLEVNGELMLSEALDVEELIDPGPIPFFAELPIAPGTYHLRLTLEGDDAPATYVFFDGEVTLQEGNIFSIGIAPRRNSFCRSYRCLQ